MELQGLKDIAIQYRYENDLPNPKTVTDANTIDADKTARAEQEVC